MSTLKEGPVGEMPPQRKKKNNWATWRQVWRHKQKPRKRNADIPLDCLGQIALRREQLSCGLKAATYPSAGRGFAEHIPVITQNTPLLWVLMTTEDISMVTTSRQTFPAQQKCHFHDNR
jgi:hypothetical protein